MIRRRPVMAAAVVGTARRPVAAAAVIGMLTLLYMIFDLINLHINITQKRAGGHRRRRRRRVIATAVMF